MLAGSHVLKFFDDSTLIFNFAFGYASITVWS